ncbi:hypothetical protein HPB52_021335 [Rhipicephalus sanguineus]|uniref:Uncharacterized protein n=1 Tax=Rhipicephalus sanguineus TaxID=34632 RepID=A0A9D4PCH9_RHISA|nr:hypothetical protein HPB52_021335 [Rhipicephalus sanguineus]
MAEEKLGYVMRETNEHLFAGLALSPPKTVMEISSEGVTMENMLQQPSNQYERKVNEMPAAGIFTSTTVSSIATVIWDELHQALRDTLPPDTAAPAPSEYSRDTTYAEAFKHSAAAPPLFVLADRSEQRDH